MLARLKALPKALIVAGATLFAGFVAAPAMAEMEVSLYLGSQSAPHSTLEGTNAAVGAFSRHVAWEGKSFAPPPYYGARVMWWQQGGLGYGVEFTHTKVYLSDADKTALGFARFELTDGHNIITANIAKRWDNRWGKLSPYAGLGLGLAIPHVDANDGVNRTFGYQYTGPAMRVTAGAKYDINDRWAAFGEYQFVASWNTADLAGGHSAETRLFTNAINFGMSMKF